VTTLAPQHPARATAPRAIRIHPADTVAVALQPLAPGEEIDIGGARVVVGEEIPAGHKVALRDHDRGDQPVKYGFPIGVIEQPVRAGAHVHSQNLRTALAEHVDYQYEPEHDRSQRAGAGAPVAFQGYRRSDGRVGTRNELWILNTVGCVNHAAERIGRTASERFAGQIDGIYAFGHPYGCSQLGDDLRNTRRVLAGLMRHPNAGGVLVLGLGCESNQMDALLQLAGDIDRDRIRFFNTQDVIDELEHGSDAVTELVSRMVADKRTTCSASDLVLGHKCGGSDGLSGISANPLVGRIADRVAGDGGRVLLTEVPEMFGAEQQLMNRAANEPVFRDIVKMVNDFKQYFIAHGEPIYENPSPGNIAGGLTTLEEKSLGAIQKGGRAVVTDVLRYGERVRRPGLSLVESPGNDGVSSTAMVASGATILLFTTGRGTPLGFPSPTLKVSSNSDIAQRKPHWIDFNAGALLDGTATLDQLEDDLFALILDVASGRATNNERNGYREIAIWKAGVTL
jgi:altronate hydrolase